MKIKQQVSQWTKAYFPRKKVVGKISKPRLIILEGPAGVGKTTIQKCLYTKLKHQNRDVGIIPEFTSTSIGKLLKKNAKYCKGKPNWLTGLKGNLIFLSDKIQALELAVRERGKIWICDRFIDTQFIVGLREITEIQSVICAKTIIHKVSEFAWKRISGESIYIFLIAKEKTIKNRLEKRIKRPLKRNESRISKDEIKKYNKLAYSNQNSLCVRNESGIDKVCEEILNHINDKWKL